LDRLRDLIGQIDEKKNKYNRKLQLGLPEQQLSDLVNDSENELNYNLSNTYLLFLKITDGLDHNGIVIYASKTSELNGLPDRRIEGIVEANKLWREGENEMIFIYAESGDYLYIHDLEINKFQIVDRITQDEICTFDTFDRLLFTALENMLDIFAY